MKESLTNLCETFLTNIELIYRQKGFKMVSPKIMPMCSYAYITSGKAVEAERLQECLKLVESKGGGSLSGMRDAFQGPHACTLAVSENPADTIDLLAFDISNRTDEMKKILQKFFLSNVTMLSDMI